ncbi:hypothetical protein ACLB1M_12595 [Escherichia coli]
MYRFDLCEQQQKRLSDGQFLVGALAAVAFSPWQLLMHSHLPDGGKLTLTVHFTHYENGHAVEQRNLPDVVSVIFQ